MAVCDKDTHKHTQRQQQKNNNALNYEWRIRKGWTTASVHTVRTQDRELLT